MSNHPQPPKRKPDHTANGEIVHSFVLPASFDPFEFLPERLKRRADDARYLVGLIGWKRCYGRTDERGRVPLMGKYLKRIMQTHDYRAVVDSLLDRGAIHRDNYVVGDCPYSYWLDDRYRGEPHIRVDATDRRLVRALDRFHAAQADVQRSRMRPVHVHLARMQYQLGIDHEAAMVSVLGLPLGKRGGNPFDSQSVIVRDLHERRLHFSVGRHGRVSNSVTSLSSHVRPALHHRGQPLVNLDIRCCQPALLGQLVAKSHKQEQQQEEEGTNRGEQQQQGNQQGTIYDSQNELPGGVSSGSLGDNASLSRYLVMTQSGEFYDFLVSEMDGLSRDEIKRRFLCDVLAKRKANKAGDEYKSVVEDRFAMLFPLVYRYIRTVNKQGWQHANLIRQLQRAESALVIGQVCEGLRLRHPEMFVVSLHDAVYSIAENMQTIRAEFERAFDAGGYSMSLSGDEPKKPTNASVGRTGDA